MYHQMPLPISCAMFGAFAGLLGGACSQSFPIWVGATTGASLGCAMCICEMMYKEKVTAPVAREPVILQNVYITYLSGNPKELPVAKVAETSL
jgi:hypothetical protein